VLTQTASPADRVKSESSPTGGRQCRWDTGGARRTQPALCGLIPNPLLPPELGDGERVCYSGDLVKSDEEGFLYYVGRRDTLIKSPAITVGPTEIEEVLYQSERPRQAAIIGLPDSIHPRPVNQGLCCRS
jgi:acyl-CoA synthetase (AMP-forming)/AMP-acid ligase II